MTMWLFFRTVVTMLSIVVAAGQNEGMAIWAQTPPAYALWNGTGLSASQQMREIDGSWIVIRGAYSPIRDEAIVIGISYDAVVTGQIYMEGKWSSLPFSLDERSSTFQSRLWKGFYIDVRYESQSGNPLLVWNKRGTSTVKYAKWTRSSWSLGTITTPVKGGDHGELNLEASPKTNEMVLVVGVEKLFKLGEPKNDYAIVWNGSSWGDGVDLKNSGNVDLISANVAFEQQSGRAVIIYANGTKSLKYQIWNGVTWSGEGAVSPPAGIKERIQRVAISADPSTNRIVVAVTPFMDERPLLSLFKSKSDSKLWTTVWDGDDTWGSKAIVGSGLSTSNLQHGIAVAFEGTSQKALTTYKQGDELKYRTWSSSAGWSEERGGPTFLGKPNAMLLSTDKRSNDVMMAIFDEGQTFCKWNGAEWGEVQRVLNPGGTSSRPQPLFFMWKLVADTAAPTAVPTLYPTSPPTQAPTLAPTKKPTQAPTHVPTPAPTKKPTQAPTHGPTSAPTKTPTASPTLSPSTFPTPAPSKKRRNHPTTPTSNSATPAGPDQTHSTTKTGNLDALDVEKATVAAGHPCNHNLQCISNTCRNGVCMATSACYPLKHKFGEPFFEHKINIVFVASGFDDATIDEWHTHVNRTYKSFEDYKMFSNEIEQLNMFRVDPFKLDASYCTLNCLGLSRLLCCHQHRALTLAQKCFPVGSNLQTVVIHNDKEYGGAGYVDANIATATTHPKAPEIAAHELGHSLFDLDDEYSYGSGTDESPNCASDSNCDKWSDLIGNTPAGYDPVRCLPGCRNGNFYVGSFSFMNFLDSPVGAVNDRFACCTYFALTKSFPSFCEPFNKTEDYLLNYCMSNDYQGYGRASYEREPLLYISDGSVQDSNTKYVQVPHPRMVLITTKKRHSGATVCRAKHAPLEPGMFLRSHVEGDFSSPRMAKKEGCDSLFKVVVFYQTRKETLFYCRNTAIEVPISQDPTDDDEPLVAFEQVDSRNIVLDTKGARVKKVAVKCIDLS